MALPSDNTRVEAQGVSRLVKELCTIKTKSAACSQDTVPFCKTDVWSSDNKALNKSWLIIFVWEALWWPVGGQPDLDPIEEPLHETAGGRIRTAGS
ncbi:hypothetical protein V6N13_144840 [Hibiscus sabdariffa]|uniref:Uncharacterized protein n=1 Tax=Hibiscus sabdariffa TaxID=183260 RepID=A0ABR2FMB9_9ROSI